MTPQDIIDQAWDDRARIAPDTAPAALREAVADVLAELDAGRMRVAEKRDGQWIVHQWLKKAVLLSFRLRDSAVLAAPGDPVQLAAAVQRVLGDPDLAARLAATAWRDVQAYAWERRAEHLEALMREVIGGHGGTR